MSIIKLIATVSLAVAIITMVTSNQLSIYATSMTEDEGWVEGDDDSQGEISSQEELEEAYEGTQWEDDIGPNEFEEATDNDDENDDDENDDELVECEDGSFVETEELCEQIETLVTCSDGSSAATQAECLPKPEAVSSFVTCSDGSSAATQAECPPPKDPSSYCNTPAAENSKSCWDVKDNSEDTGLYSCNDGTHKTDWRDCKDVSDEYKAFCKTNPLLNGCRDHKYLEKIKSCDDLPFYMTCPPDEKKNDNDNDKKVIQKTTVIQSVTATATANANTNAADVSNCKLNGSADGIQQKFNPVTYQACGLYTAAHKAYYDGFVAGCMQVGNTKLICETVANSNVVAPPAQTQTAAQPTQAIQPSDVS